MTVRDRKGSNIPGNDKNAPDVTGCYQTWENVSNTDRMWYDVVGSETGSDRKWLGTTGRGQR